LGLKDRVCRIPQDGYRAKLRDGVLQQLQRFASDLHILERCPRHVAPRLGEAADEAGPNRITDGQHHDEATAVPDKLAR
jgi:hypothetical protein